MDLTRLRLVVRSLVQDPADQSAATALWQEIEAFKQLSSTEQDAVRALARQLQRSNGDIEALLPAGAAAEWC